MSADRVSDERLAEWAAGFGYMTGEEAQALAAAAVALRAERDALRKLSLFVQGCVVRAAHALAMSAKDRGIDGASMGETVVGVSSGLMEVDAMISAALTPTEGQAAGAPEKTP